MEEDFKDQKELLLLEQENQALIEKKKVLEAEYQEFREKTKNLEEMFNESFRNVEQENEDRQKYIEKLDEEIRFQNEEIKHFQEEKKHVLEDYEAKLNLKNIRYELELDDLLRNKKGFGTEAKPQTVNSGKFSAVCLKVDSKKKLKFQWVSIIFGCM